ncbi:MAG: hypothetical protein WBG53_24020 [Rhodococcus sp. (in: high G+C Gram-positive bacteria)]
MPAFTSPVGTVTFPTQLDATVCDSSLRGLRPESESVAPDTANINTSGQSCA